MPDEQQYRYDVFIAYANPDCQQAKDLFDALADRCRAFVASRCLEPATDWDVEIPRAQRSSKITAVLVSRHADAAFYLRAEIAEAIALSRHGPHLVVPVFLEPDCPRVPYGLRIKQGISWSRAGGAKGVADKLVGRLRPYAAAEASVQPQESIPGIAPRSEVFGATPLPGQVFAAELLTQPIILNRVGGRTRVIVDRRGVRDAVYSTVGKNWLCARLLQGDVAQWAGKRDAEIHDFLAGRGQGDRYVLSLHNFPLRWASGGVLSVIEIERSDDLWTPFFFRDIPPVGWNIALGASESTNELNDPWTFLLREFLEETLVLPGPPASRGVDQCKTLAVGDRPGSFRVEREQAFEFAKRHIELRNKYDFLGLRMATDDPSRWDTDEMTIYCSPEPTLTELQILDSDGRPQPLWRDVLVCLNLTELGIEIVKVLQYKVSDTDYLLDGEILGPAGADPFLVRMPVGLFSHRFLKRAFGGPDFVLEYVRPNLFDAEKEKSIRAGQPSLRPHETPREDEIRLFHWDALQRRKIGESSGDDSGQAPDSPPVNEQEIKRHKSWKRNFERYFLTDDGAPTSANPHPLFTPASAKILHYYFANCRGPRT